MYCNFIMNTCRNKARNLVAHSTAAVLLRYWHAADGVLDGAEAVVALVINADVIEFVFHIGHVIVRIIQLGGVHRCLCASSGASHTAGSSSSASAAIKAVSTRLSSVHSDAVSTQRLAVNQHP